LVVAGDAAYNGVHQLLSQTDVQKRREWIAALDKIESLEPRTVVAGHKRPGSDDSPRIIEETRQYIRDFDRLVETTETARAQACTPRKSRAGSRTREGQRSSTLWSVAWICLAAR
jgi:hypothetical protein